MNPNTGELRRFIDLPEDLPAGFVPVPPVLQPSAELVFAGADNAVVNLKSNSKLARWAADERKKAKRKAKTAAASRRKNRK